MSRHQEGRIKSAMYGPLPIVDRGPYTLSRERGNGLRILLVDDHAIFREALAHLLVSKDPSLTIVGSAATARDAVKAVIKLEPDLVVLDLMLTGASGISTLRELRRLDARCRILVLTAMVEPGFAVDAFSAGADGFALKEQSIEDLLVAIGRVALGTPYVAPRIEQSIRLNGDPVDRPAAGGVIASLSAREREVFHLVVAGYTNLRISGELFISVKTVETHRTRINKKLRVHSTVELLRLAALHGLVSA
jgi:two-component system, NarL family, response regulator NreC